MKQFILTLVAALIVSTATAQSGSDIPMAISEQTGASYACTEQAIAEGSLIIRKPDGFTEICDKYIKVVIDGKIPGCDGGPDVLVTDKVIILEDENFRQPK